MNADGLIARLARAKANPPRMTPIRVTHGRDRLSRMVGRQQFNVAKQAAMEDVRRQVREGLG